MNKDKTLDSSWRLVGQSMNLIRSHVTPFVYLVALPSLLSSLGYLLLGEFITPEGVLVLDNINPVGLGVIATATLWTLFNIGPVTHFELSATKDNPKLIRHYYKVGLRDTPRVIGLYLLSGIVIAIGLLLLIIPGLIAIRMLLLSRYYLIDKKLPIIQAMKMSATNTKPYSGYVWGVIGVQIAVVFIAAFFGLIPAIGIVLSELATFSIAFLLVLRYRSIEH